MKVKVETQELRILDFDIETRKIGFHYGGKFAPDGCEPIAIAFSWVGSDKVEVYTLAEADPFFILMKFLGAYNQADMVTGHYVRKFDLPILNGAMMEHKLRPLPPKLVSDTKTDLVSRAGFSASQENLAAMYNLAESKFHMCDHYWRDAARLTPEGLERSRRRCHDDVKQHKALREALLLDGWLRVPREWQP